MKTRLADHRDGGFHQIGGGADQMAIGGGRNAVVARLHEDAVAANIGKLFFGRSLAELLGKRDDDALRPADVG
jgi:hypothetical protein